VLFELEALDVVVGQPQGPDKRNRQDANDHLHVQPAAERVSCDHESTGCSDQAQEQDHVAVDAVEQDDLVADGGHELEACEEPRGEDSSQVHDDSRLFDGTFVVVIAVEALCVFAAEDAVVAEVLEPREGEAHHGAGEDEEESEVVALGEADGVVELAHHLDEGICRRSDGCCCHFGRWVSRLTPCCTDYRGCQSANWSAGGLTKVGCRK